MNNTNTPDYSQYRHPLKRPVQTVGMSSSMGAPTIMTHPGIQYQMSHKPSGVMHPVMNNIHMGASSAPPPNTLSAVSTPNIMAGASQHHGYHPGRHLQQQLQLKHSPVIFRQPGIASHAIMSGGGLSTHSNPTSNHQSAQTISPQYPMTYNSSNQNTYTRTYPQTNHIYNQYYHPRQTIIYSPRNIFTGGANSSNVRYHPPHSSDTSYSPQQQQPQQPQQSYTMMQSSKLSHFDYRDNDFSRNSNVYVSQSLYPPASSSASSTHSVYQMSHIPQYSPSTQQHINQQLTQLCPPPSTLTPAIQSNHPTSIQTSHTQPTYMNQSHAVVAHHQPRQPQPQPPPPLPSSSLLPPSAPVPPKSLSPSVPPSSQATEQPTFATLQPRARPANAASSRPTLPPSSLTATGRSHAFLSNAASSTSSNYSSPLSQRGSHPNVVISTQSIDTASTQPPPRVHSLASNTSPSLLLSPKSNTHTVSPSMSHTFNTNQSIKSFDRKLGGKTDNGSSQVVSATSTNIRPIIISAPNLKTTNQLQATPIVLQVTGGKTIRGSILSLNTHQSHHHQQNQQNHHQQQPQQLSTPVTTGDNNNNSSGTHVYFTIPSTGNQNTPAKFIKTPNGHLKPVNGVALQSLSNLNQSKTYTIRYTTVVPKTEDKSNKNVTMFSPIVPSNAIRQNSPEKRILPKLKSTPGPIATQLESRKRKQPLQSVTPQNKSVKTERPELKHLLSPDGSQHMELVNRVTKSLETDKEDVQNPNTTEPFQSFRDAFRKLMKYHIYQEPDLKESYLKKVDKVNEVVSQQLILRKENLERRLQKHLIVDAARDLPNLTYCCDYITLLGGSIAEEKAEIIRLKGELEAARTAAILSKDQSTKSDIQPESTNNSSK